MTRQTDLTALRDEIPVYLTSIPVLCSILDMEMIELTAQETSTVLIGRIAGLSVGEALALPSGRVVRVRPREFVLHADNSKDRARWGTLDEISEDAAFFLLRGVLPKAQGGRW